MSYDLGQMVRLPVTVKDDAGTLTNATMAIVVVRPDETVYPAPAIVNDSTGQYHADVTPDGTNWGPWTWTWTASGTVVGVYTGQFFVRSPGGPQLVSVEETKKHLNKAQAVKTDDEELRDWIHAARWVIERITGPIVPATVIEYHDGGRRAVTLRKGPILSVTEVVERWGPDDIRTLTAEPESGVGVGDNDYRLVVRRLSRRSNGYDSCFPYGSASVKVTYRVGRHQPQDNYRLAALELISHMWRASQLASGQTRPRSDVMADVLSPGYAVPNRVREMLGVKRGPRLGG